MTSNKIKFHLGDRVRLLPNCVNHGIHERYIGKTGKIVVIGSAQRSHQVLIDGNRYPLFVSDNEMEKE